MELPMLDSMISTWHCSGYRGISRCLAEIQIASLLEENLLVSINETRFVICYTDINIGGGSVMLQAMAYGGTVGDELYDGVRLSLFA